MANPFPTLPLSVSSSSSMSDDVLATQQILVNNGGPSPVAAVLDPTGAPACLAISADDTPQLLYVTQTAGNQGGWQSTPISGAAPLEVVAGIQQEVVHAFYNDNANLNHISQNSDGSWSNPDTFPLVSQLGLAVTPLTGSIVVYGVTTGGDLQMVRLDPQTSQWQAATIDVGAALTDTDPLLVMVDEDTWQLAVQNGVSGLSIYGGSGDAVTAGPTSVNTTNPVQSLLLGFAHNNSTQLLFSDTKGTLFTSANFTDDLTAVANVSALSGTAFVDAGGSIAAYLADSSNALFVLHQNGFDENGVVQWFPALPISAPITSVNAVPPQQLPAPCLFAVGVDASLQYYDQDQDTRVWRSASIQQSHTEWTPLTQYRTEIVVTDANGIPVPNQPVSLSASSTVAVASGGQTYVVGLTQQPASLTTDVLGRISLTTPAFSLSTPQLTVTTPDGVSATVAPNQPIFDYLSGASTSLNDLPPFSTQALTSAFPGQLQNNATLAQVAARMISSTAAAATASTTVTDPVTGQPMTSFGVDFTGSSPVFTPNPPSSGSVDAAFGLTGDFLGGLGHFASDIWHGIRKGVMQVANIVVDVANKTVQLAVKIGNDIHNLGNLALDGIEAVASILHGIFSAIGAFVSDVIAWLKALFLWSDIWDTKTALESILNQSMPELSTLLTYGKQLEHGFFTKKETEITSYFTQLKTSLGGKSLQDLVSQETVSAPQTATAFVGGSATNLPSLSHFQHKVEHNWVIEKIMTLMKDLDSLVPTSSTMTQPFTDLTTAFQKAWPDLLAALHVFWDTLKQLITDPKSVSSLPVGQLLDGLEKLLNAALILADGIVGSFLDLANEVVLLADTIWTADLSGVPLLGSFYSLLQKLAGDTSGEKCTIGGLLSLALAVPLTLVYKLLNGAESQLFPGGTVPSSPSSLTSRLEGDSSSRAEDAIKFTLVGVLLIGALFDTCTDAVIEAPLPVELIAGLFIPVLAQCLSWPGGIPFTAVTLDSTADKVTFAKWMSVWCLPLINIATMLLPGFNKISKFIDPIGIGLLTSFGVMEMVAGIVAAILGGLNPLQIAEAVVYPIANIFQFLRLDAVIEATDGASLLFKLAIDFFDEAGDAALVAVMG
jgi:hypothetical protein